MKPESKSSRKIKVSVFSALLSTLIPLAYKNMGISDSITMEVLAIVASLATVWGGLHVLDKKLNGDP